MLDYRLLQKLWDDGRVAMELEVGAFSSDRLGIDRRRQLVFFTEVPLLKNGDSEGKNGLVFIRGVRPNRQRVAMLSEHGRFLVPKLFLIDGGVQRVRLGHHFLWVVVERSGLWSEHLGSMLNLLVAYQREVLDDSDKEVRATIPMKRKFLHGHWHGELLVAYNRMQARR